MTDAAPTPSAGDDFNTLLNIVIPFAKEELVKRGEFFPFGAVIATNGDEAFTSADPDRMGEQPEAQEILDVLYEGAQSMADDLRAAAFCCDIRFQGGDAIRVEVEHRDDSLIFVVPYALADGKITESEPVLFDAPGHVWRRRA